MENKEFAYKPIVVVPTLIIIYVILLLLLYFQIDSPIVVVFVIFTAIATFFEIRKLKQVIIVNSEGIRLFNVFGNLKKYPSVLFVEWSEIKEIHFCEIGRSVQIQLSLRKDTIYMEISDYLGELFANKRLKQFKKDVYHSFNEAKKHPAPRRKL
ncbi:MAG: hypothetical protein MJZ67_08070 [Bacteroidales bacterium]|nr:hypothetical protein [Bacteroidales bacterium]